MHSLSVAGETPETTETPDTTEILCVAKNKNEMVEGKINRNKERDLKNSSILNVEGWNAFYIFECQLKKDKLDNTLNKFINGLNKIS